MKNILTIEDLRTYFFLDEGIVNAVEGVDLSVPRGITLGVVGESGCGKSVTAFSVLRLISSPGKIVSGRITLHREDGDVVLTDLQEDGREIRSIRGREIAMIFQEPMTSLSPVHTIGDQIREAILLHTDLSKAEAKNRAVEILGHVGIPDAPRQYSQYPHEMSGGLRQRTMIAMALSCRPALLIADEPTTALDVTIQAQILRLMKDLQAEIGMSILLITHDLGVIAEMADEVAVMYLGRVVEQASVQEIFANPVHPYTKALLKSIPGRGTKRKSMLNVIRGSVPDPFQKLEGCPFHPRCEEAKLTCRREKPPKLTEVSPGHKVACFVTHRAKS